MEVIKNNFHNDEIIRWERTRVINFRKKYVRSLILAILLLSFLNFLIGLFFWYAPSWQGEFYLWYTDIQIHPLIIYVLILSIFIFVTIFALSYGIHLYVKGLHRLDLRLKDLKSYELIHLLTNKRWIQKDFTFLLHVYEETASEPPFPRINDVFFLDLSLIDKVTVKRVRSAYKLEFHLKNKDESNKCPLFRIKLNLMESEELEKLKKLLSNSVSVEAIKD